MDLKELLGENYKDDMTVEDINKLISKMNLADLSKGEHVAKGKLTEAESTIERIKKEYSDYKASKQTEEEKKIEADNAEKERVQGIEKELATLRAKDQLLDNGFSKDEIKYLIDNEQSPSAFAKVMADRVQSASEKAKAKDIKENTQDPAASDGNLNVEPSFTEALREKLNSN